MIKYILIAILATAVAGCAPQQVKTEYQQVNVPVYVTPTPPAVQKPDLYLKHLTPTQQNDIGELSKAFRISLKQEQQYACMLQKIVDKYAELAKAPSPTLTQSLTLTDQEVKDCNN